jgi:hypothetical protein
VTRHARPPSGSPPPEYATLGGARLALPALAEAVADRYFAAFPEDLERYGDDVARAWELHDTRYLLSWAVADAEGYDDLGNRVAWLAKILEARDFPLEHLGRNLELAGDVVAERLDGGKGVAERLYAAARLVRETPSFL